MAKKVLYIDTETTGTDHVKNDVIQIGLIIVIDGYVEGKGELFAQPFNYDNIEQDAIKVHGITEEMMRTFPTPQETHAKLIKILEKYVNKLDPKDKFWPAGYNVRFDLDFMSSFFQKCGDKFWGSWQNWKWLDPLPLIRIMEFKGIIPEDMLENHKLETVLKYFSIDIGQAHDAMADVEATRTLLSKVGGYILPEPKETINKDEFVKLFHEFELNNPNGTAKELYNYIQNPEA